jgi:peptidoglycan/LPS O-acetylase OafA/YrhL
MNTYRSKIAWAKIGLCLLVFLALKYLVSFIALSTIFGAEIEAKFDHRDVIDLYYASSSQTFQDRHYVSTNPFNQGIREKKQLEIHDGVARKIRLDLGRYAGRLELYNLSLVSHFGKRFELSPQQIYENFTPNQDVESVSLEGDHVSIVTRGSDPYIILRGTLIEENVSVGTILPVIYAFVFFLFISHFSFSSFPAFADLHGKTSSLGVHISSLDGLRGLAAFLVLAEHTGVLNNIGSLGVWFFFALSGFLLTTPFAQQPARALSYDYMSSYLLRRFKRLMPMYYALVGVTMLASGRTDEVIRHFLFLQANGHYWTLAQEMYFYLVLPLLVALIYLVFRGNKIFAALFLFVLMVLANEYLTKNIVSLYGQGQKMQAMIGVFLAGMVVSYFYHWLGTNAFFLRLDRSNVRRFCSVAGLFLLFVLMVLSARLIPSIKSFNALHNFGIFGLGAAILILLIVFANNTLLNRIMNFYPFRAVGLVGLSFYLIHPMVISFVRTEVQDYFNIRLGGPPMFILVGIITYVFSAFTYTYIERPFLYSAIPRPGKGAACALQGQVVESVGLRN